MTSDESEAATRKLLHNKQDACRDNWRIGCVDCVECRVSMEMR